MWTLPPFGAAGKYQDGFQTERVYEAQSLPKEG